MYSVSFFSKSFRILFCSSSDTSASASFLSNIQRLSLRSWSDLICAL
uniref:Uncharacterized protein n=1 Tax=Arundo donax TaxID=35708 RepID=A0A0A9F4T4_ARUDO